MASLDAYRGLVMLLMVSSGLGLGTVAERFPHSRFWQLLSAEVEHVRWQGCSLWDLIMPAFLFITGVALPFSVASRIRRGHRWMRRLAHALWRSSLLILLGWLVWSDGASRTDFMFINVLCQIGLAYTFAFLMAGHDRRVQVLVLLAILLGYWYWFYQYPLPGPSFDYQAVGVPQKWHHLQGIAAHWDLNTNPASAFDRWFLNLFPREQPFRFRAGGGTTLNFVPSIATMLLGVMVGELLRDDRPAREKLRRLIWAGTALLIVGVALDPEILPGVNTSSWTLCPIVKRIWTPSYVLYSGGWVMLAAAFFYWVIDVRGRVGFATGRVGSAHQERREDFAREGGQSPPYGKHAPAWTFPFVVVGMNSLVMYLLAALSAGWVRRTLHIHLGPRPFDWTYGPIIESLCILIVLWLACWYFYRRRLFVRL